MTWPGDNLRAINIPVLFGFFLSFYWVGRWEWGRISGLWQHCRDSTAAHFWKQQDDKCAAARLWTSSIVAQMLLAFLLYKRASWCCMDFCINTLLVCPQVLLYFENDVFNPPKTDANFGIKHHSCVFFCSCRTQHHEIGFFDRSLQEKTCLFLSRRFWHGCLEKRTRWSRIDWLFLNLGCRNKVMQVKCKQTSHVNMPPGYGKL